MSAENAIPMVLTPRSDVISSDYSVRNADHVPTNVLTPGRVKYNFETVDSTLFKYGYSVEDRINLTRPGHVPATFVKALSPMGFHIFVKIEDEGIISYSAKDLSLTEAVRGSSLPIPSSVKRGTYTNAGNSMIMCKDGICNIEHNPTSTNPIESQYIYTSQHHDETMTCPDSIIAYPVVTLGEITSNPQLVLRTTAATTTKIRQATYTKCQKEFDKFNKYLAEIITNYNSFASNQKHVATTLSRVINELSTKLDSYISDPPENSDDIAIQRIIRHNLEIKDNLSATFLDTSANFVEINKKMGEVLTKIEELNEILSVRFDSITELEQLPIL